MKIIFIGFFRIIVSIIMLAIFWLFIIYILLVYLYRTVRIKIDYLYLYKMYGFGRFSKIFRTEKQIVDIHNQQYLLEKEENGLYHYLSIGILFDRQGIYLKQYNFDLDPFIKRSKPISNNFPLFFNHFNLSTVADGFVYLSLISFFFAILKNIKVVCQGFDNTPPLLIPWQDISGFKILHHENGTNKYQFSITRLNCTSIFLRSEDIKKIEEISEITIDTYLDNLG